MPLRIAAAAADVVELAALAAAEGKPVLRPDATAAAMLAEAAVRAATHLVDVDLAAVPGGARSERSTSIAEAAEATRGRRAAPSDNGAAPLRGRPLLPL